MKVYLRLYLFSGGIQIRDAVCFSSGITEYGTHCKISDGAKKVHVRNHDLIYVIIDTEKAAH